MPCVRCCCYWWCFYRIIRSLGWGRSLIGYSILLFSMSFHQYAYFSNLHAVQQYSTMNGSYSSKHWQKRKYEQMWAAFVCVCASFFRLFHIFFLLLLYTNIEHTHTHTPTCPDANTFKTTGMIEQNVYSKMVLLFFSYRNNYDMEEKLIASLRRWGE